MTAKQYLRNIRYEQKELLTLQELKEEAYYNTLPSGIRYDKDNIQVSPSDVMLDKVIKVCELTKTIDKHIKKINKHRSDAMRIISRISKPEYRQVLTLYYLKLKDGQLMSWLDIAEEMGYSEDWIYHQHGYALQEFSKFYVDKDEN